MHEESSSLDCRGLSVNQVRKYTLMMLFHINMCHRRTYAVTHICAHTVGFCLLYEAFHSHNDFCSIDIMILERANSKYNTQ